LTFQKTYLLTGTRMQSKDVMVIELLDESSPPNALKNAVVMLDPKEYAQALANVPVPSKITMTLTVETNVK